eukprot:Pgem_evm1s18604
MKHLDDKHPAALDHLQSPAYLKYRYKQVQSQTHTFFKSTQSGIFKANLMGEAERQILKPPLDYLIN